MSKDVIRLTIPDVSDFAKQLRNALSEAPSHVEMLNHVARAAGYRNFQHLRSQNPPTPEIDHKRIARAARYFDSRGRWESWPTRRGVRELCLWVIWARLPARERWSERQISALIDEHCSFHDAGSDPAQPDRDAAFDPQSRWVGLCAGGNTDGCTWRGAAVLARGAAKSARKATDCLTRRLSFRRRMLRSTCA